MEAINTQQPLVDLTPFLVDPLTIPQNCKKAIDNIGSYVFSDDINRIYGLNDDNKNSRKGWYLGFDVNGRMVYAYMCMIKAHISVQCAMRNSSKIYELIQFRQLNRELIENKKRIQGTAVQAPIPEEVQQSC